MSTRVVHAAPIQVIPLTSGSPSEASSERVISRLAEHFDTGGGPVMIGGSTDVYSKTVVALRRGAAEAELLILDPHCTDADASTKQDVAALRATGWVAWKALSKARES